MNIENIIETTVSAKAADRKLAASIVYNNRELIPDLVKIIFDIHNNLSPRAAWALEYICSNFDLNILFNHLTFFCNNLKRLNDSSAIRPCAKICEILAKEYVSTKENSSLKTILTQTHIDQIIETGFDWLISNQKVAVKVYTMETLFLFGRDVDWVHDELSHIIKTNIIHESKGYVARGKRVLKQIEKHKKRVL